MCPLKDDGKSDVEGAVVFVIVEVVFFVIILDEQATREFKLIELLLRWAKSCASR